MNSTLNVILMQYLVTFAENISDNFLIGNESFQQIKYHFITIAKHMTVRLSSIGPVKQKILSIKLLLFSYPSVLTYVLGAQKNRLTETVLLSTHNICFG